MDSKDGTVKKRRFKIFSTSREDIIKPSECIEVAPKLIHPVIIESSTRAKTM
jgi:hypothetical protein